MFDIITETAMALPSLMNARDWHAMAWIDGNPAVIGGQNRKTALNSVEVFRNNEWIGIAPLNIPRASSTAITIQNITWVVGGYNVELLNSIEKYQEQRWVIVEIALPIPLNCPGVCGLGNNLQIFGGRTSKTI